MLPSGALRLLDADPDLGAALDPAAFAAARRGVVTTRVVLEPGPCRPAEWPVAGDAPVGAIVVSGLLVRDRAIADAVGSEIFGPGDVVDAWTPDLGLLDGDVRWRAVSDVVLALLDGPFVAAVHRWPSIALAVLSRAGEQVSRLSVHATVHGIARVEQRLLAFLWAIAGRYGRVRPGGTVVLPMRLTHEAIGRFIGARRPTVSLALKALVTEGLVRIADDGAFVLDDRGRARLEPPPGALAGAPTGDVRALTPPGRTTASVAAQAGRPEALERLRAEVAVLRGSEGELRALFDLAGIGVVLADREDGRIVRVNDRFARIVGRDRRDLLGAPFGGLGLEPAAGRRPGALGGADGAEEVRVERPDGTDAWLRTNVAVLPVRADGRDLVLAVVEDVSAQHVAEAAVARDLRDTRLLRDLAAELLVEDDPRTLHGRIADAARELMDADGSTFQLFEHRTATLEILGSSGIPTSLLRRFHRVGASSTTSCGRALATGRRQAVRFDEPGVSDHEDAIAHLEAGIRYALSTPLIDRSGRPVGMITTHLHEPTEPTERQLRFLDLLARQAADLVERRRTLDELEAANRALCARVARLDGGTGRGAAAAGVLRR